MFRLIITLLIICLGLISLNGQDIQSTGSFLTDSAKIGMPIGFAVTVDYPSDRDIILPDSSSFYSSFEFESKSWYNTSTIDGQSTDSVIYFLRTFETDSLQTFKLQFYELKDGDSILHVSPMDTMYLIHTVLSTPDSLGAIFLQEDTQYYRIPKKFNYPFLIASVITLSILTIILWIIFGKKILTILELRRMKKAHRKFKVKYGELLNGLSEPNLPELSENILILWKKYMEKLETLPYRKLTTKELAELKLGEDMIMSLREIDRAIYSKIDLSDLKVNLENLGSISEKRYLEKLEEIQHGRSN